MKICGETSDSDPNLRVGEVRADLPGGELRLLLGAVTGLSRTGLITGAERVLTAAERARLGELVGRRMAGEPMAYLLGVREFYGRVFEVTPEVLIPRPETELLVELALERMEPGARVLDLGTGSGAIAVTLACERADARVSASDLSVGALEVAQGNGRRLGATVEWIASDWFQGIGAERVFEVIVSNPPYIAAGDVHLSQGDLRFEPVSALTDGSDGLTAIRALVAAAGGHVTPQGWLLIEHGYDQAEAVRSLLGQAGWRAVQSWNDLAGIARVSGGRWPGSEPGAA